MLPSTPINMRSGKFGAGLAVNIVRISSLTFDGSDLQVLAKNIQKIEITRN